MNSVKQERHDEAEIQELAAKLVEANKAKMSSAQSRTTTRPQTQAAASTNNVTSETKNNLDEESARGRFGWTTLGKVHVPFIFRSGDKYCAVRMVEIKVLNKYLSFLHQDIYNCTCIRSYYITDSEGRLLNEINYHHCESQFGREPFTPRDLIVRLNDAYEFYKFLDACYSKLVNGSSNPLDRCGFIRINKESVVPYTVYNNEKYVPLFYFEGETENLKLKANKLEGWDLSYLKFCCKVQGIRNELFAHDSCSVISLNDIKNYFPPGTLFEDYWPNKMADNQLLTSPKSQMQIVQWTRQPSAPPVTNHPPPSPKPATQAKAATTNQLQSVPPIYANYPIGGGQPIYHATPSQTSSSAIRSYSNTSQRQTRPTYYSSLSGPPPLIRPTQGYASYGKDDWTSTGYNNVPSSGAQSYMMMGNEQLSQNPYRPTNPPIPKYPPPLIPVRHLNGGLRYDNTQNHYPAPDVVDLSATTSNNQTHPIINQQPAHQQPPRTQAAVVDERASMTNGRMNMNSLRLKLIPIPDTPTSGNHIPYKIQKASVEGKSIPCINMKPFVFTDLLVTLPDLITNFFNNVPIHTCQQIFSVLGIELYKGNNSQMRILLENGKCQSLNDVVPMVQIRNVTEYMPQLKYMITSILGAEVSAKRHNSNS